MCPNEETVMTFLRISAAIFALALASPAAALTPATQEAVRLCAGHYPDADKIEKGLRAAGWKDRGDMAGLRMFVSPDGKTVAGTQSAKTVSLRCVLMEDGLSAREADSLAAAIVAAMPGASKLKPPTREVTGLWTGMLNNKMASVFVVRSFAFGAIKGAAVLVDTQ
jgi:hypothetical protein